MNARISTLKLYQRFIPMAAVMGMIFYLSHQPGDFVQLPQVFGLDKLLHFSVYAVLAGTVLYGLHPFVRNFDPAVPALAVILFCLLFGIADEFHQSFIPGRSVSIWDVAADGLGALLVGCVWYRHAARRKPWNQP